MPMSFGVPVGMAIAVIGAILFFATGYKTAAKVIAAVGVLIALVTVIVIALAASSGM